MLLACASTAGAAERVADIINDYRRNGLNSAAQGLARLRAAQDRPGSTAPIERRREYFAAQGSLAVLAQDWPVVLESSQRLQYMSVHQQCRSCAAEALRLQAGMALERKQFRQARQLMQQALPLAPANDDGLQLEIALLQSRLHSMQGEPQLGVGEAVRAARIADRLEDVGGRISALQMVMVCNMDLQDFERAQVAGEEALALARRHKLSTAIAVMRLNQSHLYSLTGQSARQLEALHESLRLSEHDPEVSEIHMLSLSNLAAHSLDQRQYAQAEDYARRAESLGRRLGNPQAQAAALVNWGLANAQSGDLSGGVRRVRQGIAISDELGMKSESAGMLEALAWLYYDNGQFKESYRAMQQLAQRRSALINAKLEGGLVELQEQYAADQRQRQLSRLTAESRLRTLQLQTHEWRQWLWITLSLILLLATWFGVKYLYRLRGDHHQLALERQALRRQTERDALTGVFNRHYGDTLMDDYARQPARPDGMGVGLVMLDVDHFKRINDALGHGAGDAVLVEVAGRLQRLLRAQDVLVRWGGEEFLIVVHAVSREGLATLASRLLDAIAGTPLALGHWTVPVSVSIGTVLWSPQSGLSWAEAVDLADRALYQAKADGRRHAVCIVSDVADLAAAARRRGTGRGLDGLSWRSIPAPKADTHPPAELALSHMPELKCSRG